MYQNLQDAAKVVLPGRFITLNAYVRQEERSHINNMNFHLKKLKKRAK